jgi:hypothetical protein
MVLEKMNEGGVDKGGIEKREGKKVSRNEGKKKEKKKGERYV